MPATIIDPVVCSVPAPITKIAIIAMVDMIIKILRFIVFSFLLVQLNWTVVSKKIRA